VFLSAFTTKSAVYALVRGFPGLEALDQAVSTDDAPLVGRNVGRNVVPSRRVPSRIREFQAVSAHVY
jgi:hypothetical protein